jgi:hypothetical protein
LISRANDGLYKQFQEVMCEQAKEFRAGFSSFSVATSTTTQQHVQGSHMGVGHAESPGYIGSIVGLGIVPRLLLVQDTVNNICPNLTRGHEEYLQ